MKAMNFIDLIFQTIMLGFVALSSVVMAFTGRLEAIAIIAMYGGIFLGPWQLMSSLVTSLSRGLFLKWRLIHLTTAVVYLTTISLLAAFGNASEFNDVVVMIGAGLGFAIPVALAVFYYYITIKSFQAARAATRVMSSVVVENTEAT